MLSSDDEFQGDKNEGKNNRTGRRGTVKRPTEDLSGQPREASPSSPSAPLSEEDSEAELSSPPPSRMPSASPSAPATVHVLTEFSENFSINSKSHRAPPPPPPAPNSVTALPTAKGSQARKHEHRQAPRVFGIKSNPEKSVYDEETEKLIKEIMEQCTKSDTDQKDPSTSDEGPDAARKQPPKPPTRQHHLPPCTRRSNFVVAPMARSTSTDVSVSPLTSLSPLALGHNNHAQLNIPASALPPARSLSDVTRGKSVETHR